MKEGNKTSLSKKFGRLFIAFIFIAVLISALATYITQKQMYYEQYRDTLRSINRSFASALGEDIDEFASLQDYFDKHMKEFKIPFHYADNADKEAYEFQNAFREKYPDLIYGKDISFSEMDDDLKLLYARYKYLDYLILFDKIKKDYGLEYAYYVYKIDKENYVRYMFDGPREEEIVDNESLLLLGYEVYEDPAKHVAMWEAFDKGTEPEKMDSYDNEFGHVYTCATPLMYNGEVLGVILTDVGVGFVSGKIQRSVLNLVLISVLVLGFFSVGMMGFVQKNILSRVLNLEKQVQAYAKDKNPEIAKMISKGNLINDEIGSLSDNFSEMILTLHEYMENLQKITAEKERIGAELSIATEIQASMLPRMFPAFPERKEFDLFASMDPAKEVGGDFYDFFMLDDHRLVMVMADVSGKGVPAALFMAISKTIIKDNTIECGDPSIALSKANNQLCEGNDAELFVTVWLGILDLRDGKLTFADAGHEYPVLIHEDSSIELIRAAKKRPPIATLEGIKYMNNELMLKKGDMIFLYTDGVPEATDSSDKLYGMERMESVLEKCAGMSPEELLPALRADVDLFVGDAVQFDDLTMLCIKIKELYDK